MKKFTSIALASFFVLSSVFPAIATHEESGSVFSPPLSILKQESPKLKALRESLIKLPNHLQYTEYKMLRLKEGITSYDSASYTIRPTGVSPLALEITGGFPISNNLSGSLSTNIDLLTGARAIDESLQLGSIGDRNRFNTQDWELRNVESWLSLYFSQYGYYPDNLKQLESELSFGVRIPEGLVYKKTETFYTLTRGEPSVGNRISDITPLELSSHPWDQMIQGRDVSVPDMFTVIPKDYFSVHFSSTDKIVELDEAVTKLAGPAGQIYNLGESVSVKETVFGKLGINDLNDLADITSEAAFAAYDFNFYPSGDYAVILKPKSDINKLSTYFSDIAGNARGQVGDYYIVSTSPLVFNDIKAVYGSPALSMSSAKDAQYTLGVLEKDSDGFVYISEALVQKLTGPAYRINSERRAAAIRALETLQYTVFAYRDITGSWPSSIGQIENEGYIQPNSYAERNKYSVNSIGIVRHADWGSIYDLRTTRQVPIDTVTNVERQLYDRFRTGYQSFWRGFIDPIGITINLRGQIEFHTIILPLIDESQYNFIQDVFGGKPEPLDFIENPSRVPAIQAVARFDLDEFIFNISNSMLRFGGRTEKSRNEIIRETKQNLAQAIGWEGDSQRMLDFIGDEIMLAAGDSVSFNLNNIGDLDFYLGIELTNKDDAKKFLDKVIETVGGSLGRGRQSFGFFSIGNEPIKNTYNGVEYFVVPTGFVNLYYTFVDGKFYASVSQAAINNLIDGGDKKQSQHISSLLKFLGSPNILVTADFDRLKNWVSDLVETEALSSVSGARLKQIASYYSEAIALSKALGGSGSLENVSSYYRHAPDDFYGGNISIEAGVPYITFTETERYNMLDIDYSYRYRGRSSLYYPDNQDSSVAKVHVDDVVENIDTTALLASWEDLKSFGIGFGFIEDGIEVKVGFNNPAYKASLTGGFTPQALAVGGGILVLVIVAGGIMAYVLRRPRVTDVSV